VYRATAQPDESVVVDRELRSVGAVDLIGDHTVQPRTAALKQQVKLAPARLIAVVVLQRFSVSVDDTATGRAMCLRSNLVRRRLFGRLGRRSSFTGF
jgi:hypothetical protein